MTFKEFMRQRRPELDRLANQAEEDRTRDEEYRYEKMVISSEKHTEN